MIIDSKILVFVMLINISFVAILVLLYAMVYSHGFCMPWYIHMDFVCHGMYSQLDFHSEHKLSCFPL